MTTQSQEQYDLTRGYLVFVCGEKDPVPSRPLGWSAGVTEFTIEGIQHAPELRKEHVGEEPLGEHSVRKVWTLYDPARYRPMTPEDQPIDTMEVYANAAQQLSVRLVVL